jgi:cell division protease FtsH
LLSQLEEHGVEIEATPESEPWFAILVGALPWVLLLAFFYFISRRAAHMGMGGGGPLGNFAKSKARLYEKKAGNTTFKDVAGLKNAKQELVEVVDYLKDPTPYIALGAKVPRGTLLMGPPGTGKTLLARAVAGEAGVPFFSVSASEFIEMFVGVGASRVRDLFDQARRAAPAIVYIDEIDAVGRARGTGLGGGHDEREQTLNQILSEMDGFTPHEAVMVLGGTNRPDILDPALLRPGRFDRKVALELPRRDARRDILGVHAERLRLAPDVDLDAVAAMTTGFSGADLENLLNEAAMLAARSRRDRVAQEELEAARDRAILGVERDELLSDSEKRRVAWHESGHAVLAATLPHADRLRRVTIIPHGRALGATEQQPDEERYNITRKQLLDRITVALGGRAAEHIAFDERSSGADDDLKQATSLARKMVTRFGMSEKLGPASFRQDDDQVFLGRELATKTREFSEKTAELIDNEIRAIVCDCERRAVACLQKHTAGLEKLASALLERETLSSAEVDDLLRMAEAA